MEKRDLEDQAIEKKLNGLNTTDLASNNFLMNNDWIANNYDNILQWSKNMTKGDNLADELAHYAIEKFLTHKRYEEITEKDRIDPEFGHCRGFILAIMRNSWYGKKSEFSRYHKLHRADIGHRKRNLSDNKFMELLEEQHQNNDTYDYEKDYLIEAIDGILEEMAISTDDKWYQAKLFQMYMANSNFSALERELGIPRTSISNAVNDARDYIYTELKNRGII